MQHHQEAWLFDLCLNSARPYEPMFQYLIKEIRKKDFQNS